MRGSVGQSAGRPCFVVSSSWLSLVALLARLQPFAGPIELLGVVIVRTGRSGRAPFALRSLAGLALFDVLLLHACCSLCLGDTFL
uniref:Putative secreted protein n=1 Tax=Anopheles darlingi TaxID=43151 RepID=A0A2M4DIU7_ANODA